MFAQVNWAVFTLIKSSGVAEMKSSFIFRKRVFLVPRSTNYNSYIHYMLASHRNGEYKLGTDVLYIRDSCHKIEVDFVSGNKIGLIENTSGIIKTIMVVLEETISIPLVVTEQGTIRIKGSRVSLDSIVHHFKLGATAEQIIQSFPSLSLSDVYSSIAYYLTHRQEVETYLEQQKVAADNLQNQLESNPDYQAEIAELRSRMLDRWTAAHENSESRPKA